MRVTVLPHGEIPIPVEFRKLDAIEPGQQLEFERVSRGEYRLVRRPAHPNQGLVDWLLACPEKGFFVPVDSESTDSL
jgi:bifunctional DNA-binding transcriptional regulator/antitoxin component of YhaV-PrlF toxin-antitoxin module